MSHLYTVDAANALVPELEQVAARLRDQRSELVALRDAYRDREGVAVGRTIAGEPASAEDEAELRRLKLRMRGLVDQMQAEVMWLDGHAIVLRDIATGLVDFPALIAGRQVWLCWRLGEPTVAWWHDLERGFAGRRPLADLA
jgi:hypothetical protein